MCMSPSILILDCVTSDESDLREGLKNLTRSKDSRPLFKIVLGVREVMPVSSFISVTANISCKGTVSIKASPLAM